MRKYKNIADGVIITELDNGYSVAAMYKYNKITEIYNVTYYLKDDAVDTFTLIDGITDVFDTDYKSIKAMIVNRIENHIKEGSFGCYILRSQYEQECFELGNSIKEKERLLC